MTIKLFDIEAQKQYADELETFELRSQKAMQPGSGVEWPQYPKAPEPFVDSREKQLGSMLSNAVPVSAMTAADPRHRDVVDRDGTSQSEVEGFETRWSTDEDAKAKPFALKR